MMKHKNESGVLQEKMKGKHKRKGDEEVTKNVVNHIESFHPLASHYGRDRTPLACYLNSDITLAFMHSDYQEKFGSDNKLKCSYTKYRKILRKEMRISFKGQGNEGHCEE